MTKTRYRTVILTGRRQQKTKEQGLVAAGSQFAGRLFLYPAYRTGCGREWN